MTARVGLLEGVHVLELGDGVAGGSATSLLWALGAEVTTVLDPASPHRHGRPRAAGSASLLSLCLDRGKTVVAADQVEDIDALIEEADLVVVDRVAGAHGLLEVYAELDSYLGLVERQAAVAWLTISAFGLSGRRASDTGTELTVAAASGMLSAVRDERTGQPLKLGGQQSLLNTGQAAALAACHALDLAAADAPVHLDLSAVEATLAMGPVLEVGGILLQTGAVGGAKRYGAPASFYRCADGLVRISAMEDHQWRGVVAAMGVPAWAERFDDVQARIDAPDEIDAHVASWAATRSKLEAETELQANGVPATAVYSPAEILESPQFAHREALEPLAIDDGREARVVGLPFRLVGGSDQDRHGERTRRSLQGLRVLEASRVLAVPLCGALLGVLGADVTKLEDRPRLDMYRRRGPYIDGNAGGEWSAYFALMNHTKTSAGFDVDEDRARLDALVEAADVLLDNLGPKRSTALGLGAACAPLAHPDVLAVSSSGFGLDGPHADYRAYAYNLQASGALGFLTRNRRGESAEIDIAWADLVAAYALATIIAAWAVGPVGNAGAGIDFSMTDLVVSHFNEYLAAASLDPSADDFDRANEVAPFMPNGVYPAADGWLALSVAGAEQLSALAEVLDDDGVLDAIALAAASHPVDLVALDDAVATATKRQPVAVLADRLRKMGVAAEAVAEAGALVEDPQLIERGFFVSVTHPEWGERRLVGLPWRPYGGPPLSLRSPPRLDESSMTAER